MRITKPVSFLTALLAILTLATPSASAVVGADRPVRPGEARWVGSLIGWDSSTGWSSFCSGSLISPRIVLTAAHCVIDGYNQQSWKINIGQSAQNIADGQAIDVIGVMYNTKYEEQQSYDLLDPVTLQVIKSVTGYVAPGESDLDSDIALLLLEKPVIGIEPIKMARQTTRLNPQWRVYGWGATSTNDFSGSNVLNTTSVTDATQEFADSIDTPTKNMIAAYLEDDSGIVHTTCFGDSGGPLVDGNGVLIGITSFSFAESCEEASPTVYTKVANYRTWIYRATAKLTRMVDTVPGDALSTQDAAIIDTLNHPVYHRIRILKIW